MRSLMKFRSTGPVQDTRTTSTPFRSRTRRAFVALLAIGALVASHGRTLVAAGDGTIGSLPSADGGDGSQTFYLTGSRSLLNQTITDAYGTGFYVPTYLPGNVVWLDFYGDVTLVLDEQVLDSIPSLSMGLGSGFNGGGMTAMTEIDGSIVGRPIFVQTGATLNTDFDKISGFLSGQFALVTLQRRGLARGRVDYISNAGLLTIQQDL